MATAAQHTVSPRPVVQTAGILVRLAKTWCRVIRVFALMTGMRLTSCGAYARPPPAPKMPAGLVELMEDLTRNVLKHNPSNVYEFCASHMEKLLMMRDGSVPKQTLTMDQKITRVQEKLNRKAKLRRQNYDKQMQLCCISCNLEQIQLEDQLGPSNVEDEPINSSEKYSNEIVDKANQTVTASLVENQTSDLNIVEDEPNDFVETSPELEFSSQNNTKETPPNNYVVEDKTRESIKTNPDQAIHMNIESESKDSIEDFHIEPNTEMKTKLEESVTDNFVECKSVLLDEVENKPTDSFEKSLEISKVEESAPSNLLEGKTDVVNEKLRVLKENHIEMQNLAAEPVVTNHLKDKTTHFNVAENKPADSTETTPQEVIEISNNQEEESRRNVAADQTVISDAVEDISKSPVHHEQDLVKDLEVEIFHGASKQKKGAEHNSKRKHLQNIETNTSKEEMAIRESSKDSQVESQQNISIDKFNLHDKESGANLTCKSRSVDDNSNASEENLSENTITIINNFEIEIGNNTPNLDGTVLKTINAKTHEATDMAKEKSTDFESKISDVTGHFSEYETEILTKASIVDEKEFDNKGNIVSEFQKGSQCEDQRVRKEHLEDIENNVSKENPIFNTFQKNMDVKGELALEVSVLEIPMQKKEYALLSPEVRADDKTKPITLEHYNSQVKDQIYENNVPSEDTDIAFIGKNIPDNEESVGEIKEVAAETTIKGKYIDSSKFTQGSYENMDKHKENDKNEEADNIKDTLIGATSDKIGQYLDLNIEINTEISELKSKDQKQEFKKQSNDKQNENKTHIYLHPETTKIKERSGEAEENISSTLELTPKAETPVPNDSADDSTVEDSNDSLIDQDVEAITRCDENNKSASTMDLETAAVTIQKVFRSFLFKSRCSTFDETSNDEANQIMDDVNDKEQVEFPIAKERRALGISRIDTMLQTVNEEKSLSLSTDDSSTLSSAATVIQAHVRGYLVRNKFNSHKTASNASLVNSDGPSTHSLEAEDQQKKTVLNIHIVPESDHFLSRDESFITSVDLSLDGTPPSSVNLHPLGYDKSEPRKQLKREDAIQSVSPPSNNSGKLSEDVDSVKDIMLNGIADSTNVSRPDSDMGSDNSPTKSTTLETVIETIKANEEASVLSEPESGLKESDSQSDESDVITPFEQEKQSSPDSDNTSRLLHSGEFHDMVLPTKVSRRDTSLVRGE